MGVWVDEGRKIHVVSGTMRRAHATSVIGIGEGVPNPGGPAHVVKAKSSWRSGNASTCCDSAVLTMLVHARVGVLCWVDRCFGSWTLLGLFCLLRVRHARVGVQAVAASGAWCPALRSAPCATWSSHW